MAWAIPRSTQYTFKHGDGGIGVWSLQKTLDALPGYVVEADGEFGDLTRHNVGKFQTAEGLTSDGIAGPATQARLARRSLSAYTDRPLPSGLLRGFGEMEGGNFLAAVNWSVAGGVDCGLLQRRVYDEQYSDNGAIERAFNTPYQTNLLGDRLGELYDIFLPRAGTRDAYNGMGVREKSWRLSALNHNYPAAADRFSRTPIKSLDSYWTTAQSWVTVHGFKFPDGTAVRTPLQWCHLYCGVLGKGVHSHNGNVTKYVTDWAV